jgi:hypothetical protein
MSRVAEYRDVSRTALPKMMKAVVLSGIGFDNVACREVPMPQVGPISCFAGSMRPGYAPLSSSSWTKARPIRSSTAGT